MKYQFKKGDRIVYSTTATPGLDYNTYNKGKKGTVLEDASSDDPSFYVKVHFDGSNTSIRPRIHLGNLVLSPTKEEIDRALAVLQTAGEVTFKQYKPPFAPITVYGIGAYSAVVTNQKITVGCTNISFEKFDDIALAVKMAREYNKENS